MSATRSNMAAWISARLGASGVGDRLRGVRVPEWSAVHYLGVVILWLFLLQVTSGVLLLIFYRPDPDAAHGSIVQIMGMPHGELIRAMHSWAGNLFVATIGAQAAAMLLLRQFTAPREVVWWTSLALLLLGLGLALSGAILPWSEDARLQALVSSELVGRTPLIGDLILRLLRGGPEVTGWTLHHAYGLHVGVLPAVMSVVGVVYLALLLHVRAPQPEQRTIPLYPDFFVRSAAVCVGTLILVLSLALYAPLAVGTPALVHNPPLETARPPWFLLFLHQLLRAAPAKLLGMDSPTFIIGTFLLLSAVAVALPFLDRRGSRITLGLGLVAITLWLALTVYALA